MADTVSPRDETDLRCAMAAAGATTGSTHARTRVRPASAMRVLALCVAVCSGLRAPPPRMGLSVGERFPQSALAKCGIKNRPAVVFFYGADDAPTCSTEVDAFNASRIDFRRKGFSVVGVRSAEGAVRSSTSALTLVADEGNEIRNELGIKKDFGFLPGRETYLVDREGTVVFVHQNQFNAQSHVNASLDAMRSLPPPPLTLRTALNYAIPWYNPNSIFVYFILIINLLSFIRERQ